MNARVHPRVDARLLRDHLQRRQPVSDDAFDVLLSETARARSRSYWSVVRACQTAARFFRAAGSTRVLDLGCGPGKSAAILSLDLGQRVCGVEHRPALVAEARALAQALAADVEVIEGGLDLVRPEQFDGFYAFNPFAENVAEERDCFDLTTSRSLDGYLRDARRVERWLRDAPLGMALVTLNGLGGRIPLSFTMREAVEINGDTLRLWVKDHVDDSPEAMIEVEKLLVYASRIRKLAAEHAGVFDDSELVLALAEPLT